VLVLVVVAAVLVGAWFLLRPHAWRGLGPAVVVATLLGMTGPFLLLQTGRIVAAGTYPGRPLAVLNSAVSSDAQRAAEWLHDNSRPDDVVVTNTACRPAVKQPPGCDARGYVVTAIAGRRALLEGWGYTQQAQARHGRDGLPYTAQPSPWPERSALTRELFTNPTLGTIEQLRSEYGVRWVFADRRAGPVTSLLDSLAALRHTEGTVSVYELTRDGR
jgi:hypothetical protein